jgi:hypothetical protein
MGALKKLIDASSAPKRVGGAAMNGAQFVAFLRKARRPRGCACARAACSMQLRRHACSRPAFTTVATRRMPQCQQQRTMQCRVHLPAIRYTAGACGAQLGRDPDGRLCDCDVQQGKPFSAAVPG